MGGNIRLKQYFVIDEKTEYQDYNTKKPALIKMKKRLDAIEIHPREKYAKKSIECNF